LIPGDKWSITYGSDVFSGEVRETLRNRLPWRPLVFLAEERRALQARVGSILRMIRKQIETKGEDAVLF
jgi:hypothetical protein